MTMSMRVDRHQTGESVTLFPRTPSTWIPDSRVNRCFGCNIGFNLLRRKHHCRYCGRIFCNTCSSHRELIPSYFRAYVPVHGELTNTPQRTCDNCTIQLRAASSVEWLIQMLAHTPVSMFDFFKLRLLNHEWNSAANTLLALYRGLQYKLSCQPYSSIEASFLKTHGHEFAGHIQWQLHLLSSLQQQGELHTYQQQHVERVVHCRQLLCTALCCKLMSINDVIHLGVTGCLSRPDVQHRVIHTWQHFIPEVHCRMMFWWVHLACRYKGLFLNGLIPMCAQRLDLSYAFWFECSLQSFSPRKRKLLRTAQCTFKKRLSRTVRKELRTSREFVTLLHELSLAKSGTSTNKSEVLSIYFGSGRYPLLPWDPGKRAIGGTLQRRLMSSSRPIVIELEMEDQTRQEFLLKKEDVRTDRLAMVIGYWIQSLTHIHVYTYMVFPLSIWTGCVEMVSNTTTLYELRTVQTTSLLNFIMTHNPHLNVRELRRAVIYACTGACLLGFTLGVGDRHLENILVRQDAALFHVDFGYILGDDPKHAATPMRITEGMVDAMGGRQSETFRAFTLVSQQAYKIMRLHSSFWYHLLVSEYYICEDQTRPWQRIRDHILDRFVPGEWSGEASLQIESVINTASRTSFGQSFSDFTHQLSNQLNGLVFQMEL